MARSLALEAGRFLKMPFTNARRLARHRLTLCSMAENNAARPPSDHTLRRLEAFSDIVIAFSLSQLAFTLQVPRDSNTLLAHPIHFVAFLGSFALVCAFWWLHHQLFARYFVLDPVSVVLNFAFLACTVLVVYSQQLA